jgi:starch synthase
VTDLGNHSRTSGKVSEGKPKPPDDYRLSCAECSPEAQSADFLGIDFVEQFSTSPIQRERAAAEDVPARAQVFARPSEQSRILFVTPEFGDFVKVGGLGAVSAALPRALRGHCDVRVLVPAYRQILAHQSAIQIVGRCGSFAGLPTCDVGRLETPDGLTVYVLLCPGLYDRDGTPYGDTRNREWGDNDVRFARLGLAAAELAAGSVDSTWAADVLHVNDWPAAMAPAYLAWRGRRIPSILTVHNLAYQGLFSRASLERIGAPEAAFRIEGIEFYDQVSFMKAGIFYASHVTTVSETYAREIVRPEFGCGLDGLLRIRADEKRLTGILNGIDEDWDPRTCTHLAKQFEAGDWKGKQANAESVRGDFGLAASRGPLFGLVTRLVHQKGIDLVLSVAESIVSAGGQIVVMGTGESQLEAETANLAARYSRSIGVKIGFDESDSRRIYAGSDFMLMPSRFEPCGLSQMCAQRFGTLPIGRKTGGLAETIEDGKTGFLFADPSIGSLFGAVCRAFHTFSLKRRLHQMRLRAMARDFGWGQSALSYGQLYRHLVFDRAPTPHLST